MVLNTVPHRGKETIRKAHGDTTYTGCLVSHHIPDTIHRKKGVQYITYLLALEWESHNAIQAGLQLKGSTTFLPHPPKQLEPDIPSLENIFFLKT